MILVQEILTFINKGLNINQEINPIKTLVPKLNLQSIPIIGILII